MDPHIQLAEDRGYVQNRTCMRTGNPYSTVYDPMEAWAWDLGWRLAEHLKRIRRAALK